MTELKHPIHHWLMLLKPGGVYDVPPQAFARLSSDSIECYARCSGRALKRRYRVIRGEGGRKSRGPVTVIYVR